MEMEGYKRREGRENTRGSSSGECSQASSPQAPPGPQELSKLNAVSHTSKLGCGLCGVALLWLLLTHTQAHTTPLPPQYLIFLQCCLFLVLPEPHTHILMCLFCDCSIPDTGMLCGMNRAVIFSPSQAFLFVGFCPSLYGGRLLLCALCPLKIIYLAQNVIGGV